MDLIRAWRNMEVWQGLSFNFVLLVIVVTSVQVVRVAWWVFRAAPSTPGHPRDPAVAARLSSRVTLVARSTRGLARAAVWLTCAAGAAGFNFAMSVPGSTGRYPLVILVRQHIDVLEAGAINLALCALLFASSLAFDLVTPRSGRHSPFPPVPSALDADGAADTRLLVLLRCSRLALGIIALLLVGRLLLDLRPAELAVSAQDPFFVTALHDVLEQLWSRLAKILATVGALTWLITLLESAMVRRRLQA